ncbi:MAG: SIS domain-containing protein [Firmicutes bacterium]|nr:SIS domain-containing protein [Bacillota bacterium]
MRGIEYYVNLSQEEKESIGLVHTAVEINQQPEMWRDTCARVAARPDLQKWRDFQGKERPHVILSGAGTSYYVAVALQPLWRELLGSPCEAWPTTRIITEPGVVFCGTGPHLHISFARSGNNPESIGSVKLADAVGVNPYHVGVTCNSESYLASLGEQRPNAASIVLHPKTLDRGLAMTSSFTSLIVAGQALAALAAGIDAAPVVESLALLGQRLLARSHELMGIVADGKFERVYVMGDSSLYGVALEGVLKFEEFSDGQIMGIAESFLGARHGNANVINDRTLIISLLSADQDVRDYQLSVVQEMRERRPNSFSLVIALHDYNLEELADCVLVLDESGTHQIPDSWRAPLDTVALQCMALQSAMTLGLCPDNPFRHRATARAIEGLKLKPRSTGR